jgi:cell wall-associated protease
LPKYMQVKDSTDKAYQYFLKVKAMHLLDSASRKGSADLSDFYHFDSTVKQFEKLIQKKKVYFEDVDSYQPKDSIGDAKKKYLLEFYTHFPAKMKSEDLDSGDLAPSQQAFIHQLEAKDSLRQLLFAPLGNDPNELRKQIVGDDPHNINDTNYGNNDIDDSKYGYHGTFCSGIIAASRNNGIGMDGIAGNVLIMPLRACNTASPGDEQDKDVALAIRYAVNNGARVINMSFGKYLSPQKKWVDDKICGKKRSINNTWGRQRQHKS